MAAAMGDLLYFEQHTFNFENSLVILDVDGTIVPDCGRVASADVAGKVIGMKAKGNEVRLCSNSRRGNPADRLSSRMANLIDALFGPIAMFLWDRFCTTR